MSTMEQICVQNLSILNMAENVFGVLPTDDWADRRYRFSADRVRDFYEELAIPSSATLQSVLPSPAPSALRLQYICDHPSTKRKLAQISRSALVSDELLLVDLFGNPNELLETADLEETGFGYELFHRLQFLAQMKPMIEVGAACFVPDPGLLREGKSAKSGVVDAGRLEKREVDDFDQLIPDHLKDPEIRDLVDLVERLVEENPELADELKQLEEIAEAYRNDQNSARLAVMTRLIPPPWFDDGDDGAGLGVRSGEVGVRLKGDVEVPTLQVIADVSMAMAYSIGSRASRYILDSPKTTTQQLADVFSVVDVPFLSNVDPRFIARLHADDNRLLKLRHELRSIFAESQRLDTTGLEDASPNFRAALEAAVDEARAERADLADDLLKWATTAGVASSTALVATGVLTLSVAGPALAAFVGLNAALFAKRRRNYKLANPLAPLVELKLEG